MSGHPDPHEGEHLDVGLDGDANSNGAYVHDDDEFVELVNGSSSPIDLSGYMFFDTEALGNSSPAHVVPENTILLPGKAFVLFGAKFRGLCRT